MFLDTMHKIIFFLNCESSKIKIKIKVPSYAWWDLTDIYVKFKIKKLGTGMQNIEF